MQAGATLEKIAELHQLATERLTGIDIDPSVIKANQRIFTLLKEMLLTYDGILQDQLNAREKAEEKLKSSEAALHETKEALKIQNDKLEELVEERTAQLAEAQEKSEAANQAKTDFLARLSHGIRTPMNAIVGFTHLLQQSSPNHDQLERLNKIDTSASHLLSIIDDVLDLSMLEAGKMSLEQTDFRLNTVFDPIQSLFAERLKSGRLCIKMNDGEISHWLRGDPDRLRQALLNYTSNAIKFTEKSTIFLTASELEKRDGRTLIRFEVEHSGAVIEPGPLAGLFEAFKQADVNTTYEYDSTGLGLAITQRLARLMGGDASAESEPGKGSTFWFTAWLDKGEAIEVSAVAPVSMLGPGHQEARILLVEDNAINRDVALALLKSGGLVADTAENGRLALMMIHDTPYDLVLMDVQMPVMDGLETTRIIRATPEICDIPILAMTANVFTKDRQACTAAGMNDFIAKPVDVEILFSTIAKWLPEPAEPVFSSGPLVGGSKTVELMLAFGAVDGQWPGVELPAQ